MKKIFYITFICILIFLSFWSQCLVGENNPTLPFKRLYSVQKGHHFPKCPSTFNNNYVKENIDCCESLINFQKEILFRFDTVFVFSTTDSTLRLSYSYNAEAKILNTIREKLVYGNWVNSSKETYAYDASWHVIIYLVENWDTAGIWANSWRSTDTYDSVGNMVSRRWENWVGGTWVNTWRATDTYDFNGNMLDELMENWINGSWVNAWKDTYTFDSNGDVLTYLWENWANGNWENYEKATYTYDLTKNNILQIWEIWGNETWSDSWKYSFTYNTTGKIVAELWEEWISGSWSNFRRYSDTYDNNGNRLSNIGEAWTNLTWSNYEKFENTYNSNGKALTGDYYRWDGQNWIQNQNGTIFMGDDDSHLAISFFGYRVLAHYISFLAVQEVKNDDPIRYNCSPNPASAKASISIELAMDMGITINLYDNKGIWVQKIYSGYLRKGVYYLPFSIEQLPNGIYFSNLFSERISKSIKIIVAR